MTGELDWFKSSYSDSSDINDCVEVAAAPGVMHVRDSKCVAGPQVAVSGSAWAGFVGYACDLG
ncbi:DUF397 domain-containing protein [Streptomyces sp. NPDC051567]|uniref:DUF397 domain-containing protein n=1 Tax=Streptomyces sp. NPDC051567 TaxID=3365660 RepID=UPI0037B02047